MSSSPTVIEVLPSEQRTEFRCGACMCIERKEFETASFELLGGRQGIGKGKVNASGNDGQLAWWNKLFVLERAHPIFRPPEVGEDRVRGQWPCRRLNEIEAVIIQYPRSD